MYRVYKPIVAPGAARGAQKIRTYITVAYADQSTRKLDLAGVFYMLPDVRDYLRLLRPECLRLLRLPSNVETAASKDCTPLVTSNTS